MTGEVPKHLVFQTMSCDLDFVVIGKTSEEFCAVTHDSRGCIKFMFVASLYKVALMDGAFPGEITSIF